MSKTWVIVLSIIGGQISTQIFLGTCLQHSEPTPGFCDGIPSRSEMSIGEIMKSANWASNKCAEAGLKNDQGCQRLFSAVREHCHRSTQ